MTALGYARQSRRADQDVALSYEVQAAAIRKMAGGEDIEILSDLGRSGKAGGERLRPAYQALLTRLEAGQVDEIFALNLSRLARSVPELHRIMDLAKAHRAKITTAKEGVLDPTTTTGRLTFGVFALLAEFVRDLAVDAALENAALRRSRGEIMGRLAYGSAPGQDPDVVVAAFRTAGSWNGAAAILNAAGVPSSLGRKWRPSAVQKVIDREAPGLMPAVSGRGVAAVAGGFRLSRLLRCPYDDRFLTGSHGGRHRQIIYRCHGADGDAAHPSPKSAAESALLPWVEAEWARYREPEAPTTARTGSTHDAAAELEALARRRAHVAEQAIDGGITREQARQRRVEIDKAIRALAPPPPKASRPTNFRVDIAWPGAAEENKILRSLWTEITLDGSLRPVKAEWIDPAWRTPDDETPGLQPPLGQGFDAPADPDGPE
jgi:DNA invertase Pin-like site-specific DNA recombinase